MVGKLFETSAIAIIFVAISLCPSSVTIIIPYFAKVFLSGEGGPLAYFGLLIILVSVFNNFIII